MISFSNSNSMGLSRPNNHHSNKRAVQNIKKTSSRNLFSVLKASIFAYFLFCIDQKYLVLASSTPKNSSLWDPYRNFFGDQCPLTPPFNPCYESHFLVQSSAEILDAQIVGIGERHSRKQATSQCVENLTKFDVNQTILFESYPYGMVIPCSSRKILNKQGRTCIGWDTEEYGDEIILRDKKKDVKLLFSDVLQSHYRKISEIDSLSKELDRSLKILIKDIKKVLKIMVKNQPIPNEFNGLLEYLQVPLDTGVGSIYVTLQAHKLILQQIKFFRKKGMAYSSITDMDPNELDFDSKSNLCLQSSLKACKDNYQIEEKRNHFLAKAINKYAKKGHQVIAIAGAAHFIPGIGDYADIKKVDSSVKLVRNELKKGEHVNSYSILATNEFENDSYYFAY